MRPGETVEIKIIDVRLVGRGVHIAVHVWGEVVRAEETRMNQHWDATGSPPVCSLIGTGFGRLHPGSHTARLLVLASWKVDRVLPLRYDDGLEKRRRLTLKGWVNGPLCLDQTLAASHRDVLYTTRPSACDRIDKRLADACSKRANSLGRRHGLKTAGLTAILQRLGEGV